MNIYIYIHKLYMIMIYIYTYWLSFVKSLFLKQSGVVRTTMIDPLVSTNRGSSWKVRSPFGELDVFSIFPLGCHWKGSTSSPCDLLGFSHLDLFNAGLTGSTACPGRVHHPNPSGRPNVGWRWLWLHFLEFRKSIANHLGMISQSLPKCLARWLFIF